MKRIKKILSIGMLMLSAIAGMAQTNLPPTFAKGTITIDYKTKASATPVKGVKDVYTVAVNVANSALFHGTITDQPQILSSTLGFNKSVAQPRQLDYNLDCDVVNPKNPSQTRNVGRLYGIVPVDADGVYRYDQGTLKVDILPMGSAGGFTSKFDGQAAGKKPNKPANWFSSLSVVNITRSINGKTTTVALTKYDKMDFHQHVIAAGPVGIYGRSTVNGELLYDYDKNCWFANNLSIQYDDGHSDRVAGIIRWVESPQRKQNGEGEYQFDIRLNEPLVSESAAFNAKPADESSFFETDNTVAGLSGTMKYKDTLRGDTTLASQVIIDLTGNNITKQQTMVLCKIIIFSSVVPMNSD